MSLDVSVLVVVDTGGEEPLEVELWEGNITHNLGPMAHEAGVYVAMWRPEEGNFTTAGQIIPILEEGIRQMAADPDRFRAHSPPNGWGTYDSLLSFMRRYLDACRQHPKAQIKAWR
jgi:hypothetical protein